MSQPINTLRRNSACQSLALRTNDHLNIQQNSSVAEVVGIPVVNACVQLRAVQTTSGKYDTLVRIAGQLRRARQGKK